MSITALLISIFKSLAFYLQLKNTSFYYDMVDKHYKRKKEIIDEIEKLRSKPTSSNTDAADKLLLVLKQENERFDDLSAFYSKSSKGSNDTN